MAAGARPGAAAPAQELSDAPQHLFSCAPRKLLPRGRTTSLPQTFGVPRRAWGLSLACCPPCRAALSLSLPFLAPAGPGDAARSGSARPALSRLPFYQLQEEL